MLLINNEEYQSIQQDLFAFDQATYFCVGI